MKIQLQHSLKALALLACCALHSTLTTVEAQGTAFIYQGHLINGTNAANGNYDLTFELFNASSSGSQVGSTLTNLDVGVINGLFTVTTDFGAVFNGASYWLQIGVRTNGGNSFTALSPRQELTPVPYSITAQNVTGAVTLAQLPAGLVTNNETNVAFVNLTLSGNLTLPSPATIDSDGSSVLRSDGNNDFYAGPGAGSPTNSGSANTGIGVQSLQNNSNGTNNTAIGYASLGDNTNGAYNVAIGERALASNTSGNDNTAEGRHAMVNNTSGNDNTANGYQALQNNTNGSYNTAHGSYTLSSLTSGSYNIALGYLAGNNYGEGESSNIIIGSLGVGGDNNIIRIGNGQTQTYISGVINGNGGGLANLSASQLASGTVTLARLPSSVVTNNESGAVTLNSVTVGGSLNLPEPTVINAGGNSLLYVNGNANFFAGQSAGSPSVTGGHNTGVGNQALTGISSGDYNTAEGDSALAATTSGGNNTAMGVFALWQNTNGNGNTGLGADAMAYNSFGSYNVALGASALENCTGDSNEVAIGYGALENDNAYNSLTGSGSGENTAVGFKALQASTGGSANTAVGFSSMISDGVGFQNTAIGDNSLNANTGGFQNTAIGNNALGANTGGYRNVAIGSLALENIQSGNNNIAIGFYAGQYFNSGNNNIYIGSPGVNESGVIRIGENQTATYLTGTVNCAALISGAHTCCTITITGGCDLAEPFPVSTPEQQVSEGSVMVIDEKNPGQLKLASQPYDTRVAGVISGANGINPGIQMQQQGLLEGGRNVALTGRVYVQADASTGAIEPGDLLTTSSTPGRAMKVIDHTRAQGAILGKAMTSLKDGQGMVLVLVTLQ